MTAPTMDSLERTFKEVFVPTPDEEEQLRLKQELEREGFQFVD